jgi:GT2 family glycosyltransferase
MSAVIPTYARYDLLTSCVDRLLDQTIDGMEIIVVDNASTTNIRDAVKLRYGTRVIAIRLARNYFFCGAVNRGADLATGEFLAVINDDCMVEHRWAEEVAGTFARHPEAAAVASLVLNSQNPNLIDSAGDHLDICGRPTNLFWNQAVSDVELAVTRVFSPAGSCAVYRRHLFDLAGRFDEEFLAYVDDIDLGFRLQLLDYATIFNPRCSALHMGGGTYKSRTFAAYLLERNMIWNITKNLPDELWQRHMRKILAAQAVPAPLSDGISMTGWIRGKAAGLSGIPRMLKKRRTIQEGRRISIASLEDLLLSREVGRCHL